MAELGSSSLTSRKLVLIPPMSSPVCMACVPARYVDLECKHLFESADVAAAGAQGCSCDSLVYVYLRREQDGVHCLSNLTKIKNNIGNVYSSPCVHIHHVYSSPCVHIHHVYSSTSINLCKSVYILRSCQFDCLQHFWQKRHFIYCGIWSHTS